MQNFVVSIPCNPGNYKLPSCMCKMCPDGSYQTHGYHSNCIPCNDNGGYSTGGLGASYHDLCGQYFFQIIFWNMFYDNNPSNVHDVRDK